MRRSATIAIHELGHNCGLDHHGYEQGIACVMTADTELDCLERLDQGTHRFCGTCQLQVERKLAGQRGQRAAPQSAALIQKALARLRSLRS